MNPWKELGIFKAVTSKDSIEKAVGALMFLSEEDEEEKNIEIEEDDEEKNIEIEEDDEEEEENGAEE